VSAKPPVIVVSNPVASDTEVANIAEGIKTEALRETLHLEFPNQILQYTPTNGVIPFNYQSFDPKDKRQGCFDGQYSGNHFDRGIKLRGFIRLMAFATIKGKGKLLVCGPALQGSAKTLELARFAADPERYKEVMDCATSSCRWKVEEDKIKAYIVSSVGYDRTNKVVLAAIVQSCMLKAAAAFEQLNDGGASVLHGVGVMLSEVGDYDGALVPLEQALAKQEAMYGKEAIEIVETVYMIGQCYSKIDAAGERSATQPLSAMETVQVSMQVPQGMSEGQMMQFQLSGRVHQIQIPPGVVGGQTIDVQVPALATVSTVNTVDEHTDTDGKSKGYYERALSVTEQHYAADHVATARHLVGISRSYLAATSASLCSKNRELIWVYTGTKGLGYCWRAIALIEAAETPDEHSDTHSDALYEIGRAYHMRASSLCTPMWEGDIAACEDGGLCAFLMRTKRGILGRSWHSSLRLLWPLFVIFGLAVIFNGDGRKTPCNIFNATEEECDDTELRDDTPPDPVTRGIFLAVIAIIFAAFIASCSPAMPGGGFSFPRFQPAVRYWMFFFYTLNFIICINPIITNTNSDGTPLTTSLYIIYTGSAIVSVSYIASFPVHRWRTKQAVGYYQQSLKLRESKHGQDHITTVDTLRSLAISYRELFRPVKAVQLLLQVLDIEDRTKGPLSAEAGDTCWNIGRRHYDSGRFSQAAAYFMRAAKAKAFTLGREHGETPHPTSNILILDPKRPFRQWLNRAVAMMMCRSRCMVRGRARYLDEIKAHDKWLEEDARLRGRDMQEWRGAIRRARRLVWFYAMLGVGLLCVLPYFVYSIAADAAGRRQQTADWLDMAAVVAALFGAQRLLSGLNRSLV
jgi:tetratricopeptide (TPR) repeat protein